MIPGFAQVTVKAQELKRFRKALTNESIIELHPLPPTAHAPTAISLKVAIVVDVIDREKARIGFRAFRTLTFSAISSVDFFTQ